MVFLDVLEGLFSKEITNKNTDKLFALAPDTLVDNFGYMYQAGAAIIHVVIVLLNQQ